MEVINKFKGLNLVDRVPQKLWTNIVQEALTKTIPKKCKMAKWFSEEGLQIGEERREVKGKGEKERYTQLNAQKTYTREISTTQITMMVWSLTYSWILSILSVKSNWSYEALL